MKMSVADARQLAAALTTAADQAESAGQTEFDLDQSLLAADRAALADLDAAIAEKKNVGSAS